MARGPNDEWRPPGDVACAVHVGRIATGDIEDSENPPQSHDGKMERERAEKGAKARSQSLTKKRRSEIAARAAAARWGSD